MLRVVFLGNDLHFLDILRNCNIALAGVYLPSGHYTSFKHFSPFLKFSPKFLKKIYKTEALHIKLADYLDSHRIKKLHASNVNSNEFLKTLKRLKPDLGIIANFGQILNNRLLSIPCHGFINYHPSLLPKYRGPNPLPEILINGETYSGVTWHLVTEKIDQGDILAQEKFKIKLKDTIEDLQKKSFSIAGELLYGLFDEFEEGTVNKIPQNEAEATYCSKMTKEKRDKLRNMRKL